MGERSHPTENHQRDHLKLNEYPRKVQGGYAIVNQDEKNRWGYQRGYVVHPGYSPVHNSTVIGSKRLLQNANWARYNLAVSKRKETEPLSNLR
ncbi:hypothetical protein K435DRAFT_244620 [Dendrothele bispora CBS 962.96]|uniref:Copper amine oxidase catalytic domain-containing protein n=1 Tax=Dendrothele bispora (strain CBS 962.96) TaxID=1314807 RepID=A0A4S8LPJ8_DENBC|nr:hypothetical protein K435DRAFT_244620 [Dendrothele bispora CBS 962.96]